MDRWDERARRFLVGAFVVGLGVSISLAEIALFLLAARTAWRLTRGRARVHWTLAWPIGAFVAATALAAIASARPLASLVDGRSALLLLMLWVLVDALPSVESARRMLLGLLAVMGAVSLLSVGQVAFCGAPWFIATGAGLAERWPPLGRFFVKCHRAHGFYSIYMTLGGVLTVVLLAALPVVPVRVLWAPAAWLAALVAFALTFVRGAWLGFGAGAVVLIASARRRRGVLAAGLAVVALGLLLLPGVRGRALSIVDRSDPTSSERLLMWRSGLAMARDHALTGVGPGQVKHVYPRYAAASVTHKQRGHVHNSPLQILVERGVPGLVAWLWLFAAFCARAGSLVRRLGPVPARDLVTRALAGVSGFLVAGLFEHNFGDTEVLLVALLAMALVLVVERDGATA